MSATAEDWRILSDTLAKRRNLEAVLRMESLSDILINVECETTVVDLSHMNLREYQAWHAARLLASEGLKSVSDTKERIQSLQTVEEALWRQVRPDLYQ